jgi:hypothetical protein
MNGKNGDKMEENTFQNLLLIKGPDGGDPLGFVRVLRNDSITQLGMT